MKGYRIAPGLVIERNENTVILNNTFNGYQLEYVDLSVLEIFDNFNQVDTKEELYRKYPNDILDQLFEYHVFEKKFSFIENMNNESCFRIFVFNENLNNSILWNYLNRIILYFSIPCLIFGLTLSIDQLIDFLNHFNIKYLSSLIFGFLPFCFLHEFGHCISALANKAIVYDLGCYYKGINWGFYVFYEQSNTRKGNIQISLSGAFLCFLVCGIILIFNHFLDNDYLLIFSFFYIICNFSNLLVFQGFDGYLAINFYLNIKNIESKLKYLIKHPFTSKFNKKEKIGCLILLFVKILSILFIISLYGLCYSAGLIYFDC